jgi:phosphorylcholine metabolism protein LicD
MDITTDDTVLVVLRKMLNDLDKLLNTKHIGYWIDGGTLLGAIRHQDIIPWDDDADIVILAENEAKFLQLKPDLFRMGYGLSKTWCGYKIFPLNGRTIKYWNRNWQWSDNSQDIKHDEKFDYKFPFIDVILIRRYNNIYHYDNEKVRRVWPNYYYDENDVYPLKRYAFHNFELTGPNNPLPYLYRAYGQDWQTKGYKQYDHENQRMFNKKKFNIC